MSGQPDTLTSFLTLREVGLHARVAVQQFDTTEAHARQRLLFAQQLIAQPREQWDIYIFSGEKTVHLHFHARNLSEKYKT